MGFSVGGEVLLESAARALELRAVVSEGAGFRSIREFRHIALSRWFIFPLVSFATLGTAVFSNGLPPPDLADIIGRIAPQPVSLIYAENGIRRRRAQSGVPQGSEAPAQSWRVPGSSHLGGIDAQPEEYERRRHRFLRPGSARRTAMRRRICWRLSCPRSH